MSTDLFKPRGLFGILYWYAQLPLHKIVFGGMMKGIMRSAQQIESSASAAG